MYIYTYIYVYVYTYINISHLNQNDKFNSREGLKINAEKSSFFAPVLEYLGYLLIKDGVKLIQKKQAVLDPQHQLLERKYTAF